MWDVRLASLAACKLKRKPFMGRASAVELYFSCFFDNEFD